MKNRCQTLFENTSLNTDKKYLKFGSKGPKTIKLQELEQAQKSYEIEIKRGKHCFVRVLDPF